MEMSLGLVADFVIVVLLVLLLLLKKGMSLLSREERRLRGIEHRPSFSNCCCLREASGGLKEVCGWEDFDQARGCWRGE
jgi:hypothetical protein